MKLPFFTLAKGASLVPALFFALLLLAGCGANGKDREANEEEAEARYQMGDPITDPAIAAIVESEYGSDTLTTEEFRGQLDMVMQQFPQIQNDPQQARELRRNMLEDFVLRHAVFGEADRLGLEADTGRVEMQMRQIRSRFDSEEAFQEALRSDNITEDSIRVSIREMVRQQMMLEHMAEGAEDPTELDVSAFASERAQQVRAQHILFLTQGTSGEEKDSIKATARAVLDSVKSGADFEALARRHSEDGTAQNGGDLGFFSRGQMVPPFEEAAFALADSGDVTKDLVETQYGFHIIRLVERREGDTMNPAQARQMLEQERRQAAVEESIDELRAKLTVRVNPDVVQTDLNEGGS